MLMLDNIALHVSKFPIYFVTWGTRAIESPDRGFRYEFLLVQIDNRDNLVIVKLKNSQSHYYVWELMILSDQRELDVSKCA